MSVIDATSKTSRIAIVGTILWSIGWTVFANLYFEKTCIIDGVELDAFTCAIEKIDRVWSSRTWRVYLGFLIGVPVAVWTMCNAIAWIRDGE